MGFVEWRSPKHDGVKLLSRAQRWTEVCEVELFFLEMELSQKGPYYHSRKVIAESIFIVLAIKASRRYKRHAYVTLFHQLPY